MKKLLFVLLMISSCLFACNHSEVSMTAKFQILVPEATTNLIRNPSVETNLDDWTAQGSAIARTNDEARFGFSSVQVTTNGAVIHEGVQVRSFPNTLDTIYAGSVYVKGEGQIRVRMRDEFNGNEYISDNVMLNSNRWIRIQDVVGRTGPAICDNLSLHIETVRVEATTFYVDGADIEPLAYSTTYVDGEQEGCEWEGTYHSSISIRNAYERSGGRFLDLDEDGIGVYATGISGVGMPPLKHNLLDRALIPGLEFQSTKVQARAINITLFARSNKLKNIMILHEKRNELINAIKPDIVSPTQPFILRYTGGSFPLDIPVYYEAGLEFEGDIRNENYNSFMMRLLATDPFWIEDNQQAELLDFSEILNNANYLAARINGEWSIPYDVAPSAVISAIGQAQNGDIYIGGLFLTINGIAAVRLARYDGENWYPVANGVNSVARAIVGAPDGTIYIGGQFTTDGPGGVPLNYIARYDPIADTLTQLGAGLNGLVYDIAIHPITGDVYVCGDFDDVVGGIGNTLNRIARWDVNNLTWNAMGTGPGLNNSVRSISFSRNGTTLYVGGTFSEEGNVAWVHPGTYGSVARYYPETNTFGTWGVSGLLGGAVPTANAVAVGNDGLVYVGGSFDTADGTTVNNVAQWNGTAWRGMGGGVETEADNITFDLDGNVIISSFLTEAGGLDVSGIAIWNGTAWTYMDIDPTNDTINVILITRFGDMFATGTQVANALVSSINNVVNVGSSNAYPLFEVVGEGKLIWLENQTTRKIMYLDLFVHDGETVIIDLENNTVTSNWSGNRLGDVLPESDIAEWFLAPGVNRIAAFIIEDGENTKLTMTWKPQHWSIDGASE